MAEHEEDKDVSRRYRELGREEPPPSLDAQIRAEARGALETHAAPLVPPTGRRRWYFPVAAAAVIVLAVAVTTQIEREQPAETVATAPEAKKEAVVVEEKPKAAEAPAPRQSKAQPLEKRKEPPALAEPRAFVEAPKDQAVAGASSGIRSQEDFSRDNRASPAPAAAPAALPERRLQADAISSVTARAKLAEEKPEAWLERIAELRRQGKHDEADKELAEFRKRYPDYKIPPEMLEKVERR